MTRPHGPTPRHLIYVDTSVVLAQLLAEDRHPASGFWDQDGLISSRLLEYEAWTRIHARGLGTSHGEDLRGLLARLSFLELVPPILARALEPFPVPMRTLDACISLRSTSSWVSASVPRWRPTTAAWRPLRAPSGSDLDPEMVGDASTRESSRASCHRRRDRHCRVARRRQVEPRPMSATPAIARATPASRTRPRRSWRNARARSAVLTG